MPCIAYSVNIVLQILSLWINAGRLSLQLIYSGIVTFSILSGSTDIFYILYVHISVNKLSRSRVSLALGLGCPLLLHTV